MLEREVQGTGKILVFGHRGAMGHAPENTMVSFAKGLDLGADILELDVHVSRDDKLIVMHDGDVSRTTNGTGHIKEMTLAEIKKLDAGVKFDQRFRGERVPTLGEVFDWAKTRIQLAIEIKGDPIPTAGIERKLIEMLRDYHMIDDVVVISFHHSSLKQVKELEPRVMTGILFTGMLVDTVAATRAALADSVRPSWNYWTPELVNQVHAAGLVAHTWLANDEAMLDYLAPFGFESIGTNYPDRMRSYVDRIGRGWRR
jgi:glycerophosphoryl diester phosphodiesterase